MWGVRLPTLFFTGSVLVLLAVLSPWIFRNYALFGKFIPTRDVVWQTLWEGWGEFPDNPMGAVLSDSVTYEQVRAEGI